MTNDKVITTFDIVIKEMARVLKSCSKCGRVHEHNLICSSVTRLNSNTAANKFRRTRQWRNKRDIIFNRDKALCQLCIRNMYNTMSKIYNNNRIEVHHIEPIMESYEQRLNDYNLISLCVYHHKMADAGQIEQQVLKQIVQEIEDQRNI